MSYEIDDKDKHILEVLKDHGDYTTRQIAKKNMLPATTIHHRIKKMKQEGIIDKFTIEVDHRKVGKGFMAYIWISANLSILKQKKKTQHDLVKEMKKFDFVERADIVSGGTDIIIIVRAKDVEEFNRILLGKIQMLEGIEKTQSLIVIEEGKR